MIVNIIGRGEGYEDGYDAPGEHWTINYWHPKTDVLFEIHPPDNSYHEKLAKERENARQAGTTLFDHTNFPYKTIIKLYDTDYFGSSTDWLIAYAIVMDAIEIHLWGVTMDDRGDHYEKRCCTDFWCGMAMGRGIKVVVHGNSTVMTTEDGLTYGTFQPMSRKYVASTD